jgi:hypothetical protein
MKLYKKIFAKVNFFLNIIFCLIAEKHLVTLSQHAHSLHDKRKHFSMFSMWRQTEKLAVSTKTPPTA